MDTKATVSQTASAVLHAVGDLRHETVPCPAPQDDEVLVQIRYCGICGSDLARVFVKGTYRFPTVIGHEFSGVVIRDDKGELTGKRVAVFPLLPCFSCDNCRKGNYATCRHYDYYGSRRDGGMTEYLNVKRWNILPLPDEVSLEEGAMCEPTSVARHAVRKLGITGGETLFISGAGPIGLIAGQWAKHFGASDVCYIDVDPRKLAFAETLGFRALREGDTADCFLEGTGYGDALKACLDTVRPGGCGVLMGNPAGDMPMTQDTYWQILRKELTVYGTWNSSFNDAQNDWKESLAAMASGALSLKTLVTHRYPLADVGKAFAMMRAKTEFYNKVMLYMNGEA